MLANCKINAGAGELEVAQNNFINEHRQPRVDEADFSRSGVKLQSKGCFEQSEGRSACPGLWRARDRIQCRSARATPLESAEQLRQAPQVHIARSVEPAFKDPLNLALVSIASKTQG